MTLFLSYADTVLQIVLGIGNKIANDCFSNTLVLLSSDYNENNCARRSGKVPKNAIPMLLVNDLYYVLTPERLFFFCTYATRNCARKMNFSLFFRPYNVSLSLFLHSVPAFYKCGGKNKRKPPMLARKNTYLVYKCAC